MRNFKHVFLFILLCGLNISCNPDEEQEYYRILEVTVLPETIVIDCCEPFNKSEQESMILMKENGEKFYLPLKEIQGFNYQKGFEYRLIIKEKHLTNPPQDSKNVEYLLLKELHKEKK